MTRTERLAVGLLERAASDAPALRRISAAGVGEVVRYGELRHRVEGAASALSSRGARTVLLSSPNSPALVICLLGAIQAGARVLLLP